MHGPETGIIPLHGEIALAPPLAMLTGTLTFKVSSPGMRYRLILVKCSNIKRLRNNQAAMRERAAAADDGQNAWIPQQNLPYPEIILFGYAADRSSRPPASAFRLDFTMHAQDEC